jgi:hypothetical protein
MGWAQGHIARLQAGETVSFRPRGGSMTPRIRSGQLCTVEPFTGGDPPEEGDIVLCRVGRAEYLHYIKAVQGDRFQIGNARGGINGWVGADQLFGRLVKIAP